MMNVFRAGLFLVLPNEQKNNWLFSPAVFCLFSRDAPPGIFRFPRRDGECGVGSGAVVLPDAHLFQLPCGTLQ